MRAQFHGIDWAPYFTGQPTQRLATLATDADHIVQQDDGKKRFLDAMVALIKAAGIAIHLEDARAPA